MNSTVNVGGFPFQVTAFDSAVSKILTIAKNPPPMGLPVRLSNAYCVALASENREYANVLLGPGVTFPDGTPVWAVMWAKSLFAETASPQRVRGPSLFKQTLAHAKATDITHYFLGGTDESLDKMLQNLRYIHPKLNIAGSYAPPFGPVNEVLIDKCVERVRAVRPHVVWIGLGTPKQDIMALALAQKTGTVCIGVGAAFDFMAGTVRESPRILQRLGLEWLFRLLSEPRRLWKRYLFGNYIFIRLVAEEALQSLRNAIQGRKDLRSDSR